MSAEAIIKSQARKTLKGNFVEAIIALLIVLLPLYMIDGATTALSCAILNLVVDSHFSDLLIYLIGYPVELIAGILLSPVINGYIRAYYKATYSNRIDLKDVFYYFSSGRYSGALLLNLHLVFRLLLPAFLLFSPLIAFEVISKQFLSDFYGTVLYKDIYFIFAVMSTVSTTLYSLRYFTVFTVSADNPQFSPKQVFTYNKYIMRNNTGNAAKLVFSFTPWLLLCLLVLPALYVIPYLTQSLCVSAKWMTKAALEEM